MNTKFVIFAAVSAFLIVATYSSSMSIAFAATGDLVPIKTTVWPRTISIVVPVNLPFDGTTDLLLYSPSLNMGEFYNVSPSGDMALVKRHTDWSNDWTSITPVGTNGLLFYSAPGQRAAYYSYSQTGVINLIWSATGWSSEFNQIVKLYPDLTLIYSSNNNYAQFFKIVNNGWIDYQQHKFASGLQIVPVEVNNDIPDDIIQYYPGTQFGTQVATIKTVNHDTSLTLYRDNPSTSFQYPLSPASKLILAGEYPHIADRKLLFYDDRPQTTTAIGDTYTLDDHGALIFLKRLPLLKGYDIIIPMRFDYKDGFLFFGAPVGSSTTQAYAVFVEAR